MLQQGGREREGYGLIFFLSANLLLCHKYDGVNCETFIFLNSQIISCCGFYFLVFAVYSIEFGYMIYCNFHQMLNWQKV